MGSVTWSRASQISLVTPVSFAGGLSRPWPLKGWNVPVSGLHTCSCLSFHSHQFKHWRLPKFYLQTPLSRCLVSISNSTHYKWSTDFCLPASSTCSSYSQLPFIKWYLCTGKNLGIILHPSFSHFLHKCFGIQLENKLWKWLSPLRPPCMWPFPSVPLAWIITTVSSLLSYFHSCPTILFSTQQSEGFFKKKF